jgi:putative tricarboxylic transport membrane protein
MQRHSQIPLSLFFILIGVAVMVRAFQLHVGTPTAPQPGFFPLLAGASLTLMSSILLVRSWSKGSVSSKISREIWRPGAIVFTMVIYMVILEAVGYILASMFLSMTILRLMGTKSWWRVGGVSLVVTIGSFVLFDRLLGIPLPAGRLEHLLLGQ